jgi:hypothetical protein
LYFVIVNITIPNNHDLIGSVDDFLFSVVLRLSVWRMDQVAAVFIVKIMFQGDKGHSIIGTMRQSQMRLIELSWWDGGCWNCEMMQWVLMEDRDIQDTGMSNSDLAE